MIHEQNFEWTQFYEEFADKLLAYKNNRTALMSIIHKISEEKLPEPIRILNDQINEKVRWKN